MRRAYGLLYTYTWGKYNVLGKLAESNVQSLEMNLILFAPTELATSPIAGHVYRNCKPYYQTKGGRNIRHGLKPCEVDIGIIAVMLAVARNTLAARTLRSIISHLKLDILIECGGNRNKLGNVPSVLSFFTPFSSYFLVKYVHTWLDVPFLSFV